MHRTAVLLLSALFLLSSGIALTPATAQPCNENNVCEPAIGENAQDCPFDCMGERMREIRQKQRRDRALLLFAAIASVSALSGVVIFRYRLQVRERYHLWRAKRMKARGDPESAVGAYLEERDVPEEKIDALLSG